MNKHITLNDYEDDCKIAITVDQEFTGVIVDCSDDCGNTVSVSIDARLMKQFCNKVSEAIEYRAQKRNECGEVKNVAF
jgi:hypothetical protein